ncbi:MAG: phospholipase D-like domain-containing protein [Candidatus Nanopelagicales bacterium]
MRVRLIAFLGAALALVACSAPQQASLPTPPPLEVDRTGQITLESIQPDDGVGAVISVIAAATKSIDIAVYQMDPNYSPLVVALTQAKDRGVRVRILLSGTIYPPGSTNDNPQDVEILRALGFEAALSRPEFSFSHWKVLIVDAGTRDSKALICDFNLEAGYFGIDPAYPQEGDTRGMAVIDTDPLDVDMIARTFEADWPPYKPWPANDRPNLVWSPSDSTCDSVSCASPYPLEPVGNSRSVMLSLIGNAQVSLDVYAQALAEPSELLQPLLDAAHRGVKVRIVGNDGGINSDAQAKLKEAGAEIVTNPTDPSGDGKVMYIHSKTIVADAGTPGAIAYVGSVNPFLDESLDTERELGVLLTDPTSIERIVLTFDTDFGAGSRA